MLKFATRERRLASGSVVGGVSSNVLIVFPLSKKGPEDRDEHRDSEDAAHRKIADLVSDSTTGKEN
jgi:hypothetical protein